MMLRFWRPLYRISENPRMIKHYYNENDPFAAHVLREQIASGAITPGDVDDRSIEEVTADDVKGYTQVHFFAGGGFWSVAARLAGWPDDKPLWAGSCPCHPFSVAAIIVRAVNRDHLFDELVEALEAMTQNFKPFTSKPMGAPNSQARLEQESQIEAYAKALALLAKVK